MKKIVFLFVGSLLWALLSCKAYKNVITKPTKVTTDTILSSKDYLANKIPDCDKAIAYMDSIFIPETLLYDGNNPSIKIPERISNVKILNNIFVDADIFSKQQYLYYINPDCFKNKPTATIFKVFCPLEAFDNLNKIDLMYQKANKRWYLSVPISGKSSAFGVYFGFENGKVVDIMTRQTTYSSH